MAMLNVLMPRAVSPPSAKMSACTTTTTVTTSSPSDGPSSTAARAPPRRWPDVPEATGKFTIWAAKTNAADTPARGTRASASWRPL